MNISYLLKLYCADFLNKTGVNSNLVTCSLIIFFHYTNAIALNNRIIKSISM